MTYDKREHPLLPTNDDKLQKRVSNEGDVVEVEVPQNSSFLH